MVVKEAFVEFKSHMFMILTYCNGVEVMLRVNPRSHLRIGLQRVRRVPTTGDMERYTFLNVAQRDEMFKGVDLNKCRTEELE